MRGPRVDGDVGGEQPHLGPAAVETVDDGIGPRLERQGLHHPSGVRQLADLVAHHRRQPGVDLGALVVAQQVDEANASLAMHCRERRVDRDLGGQRFGHQLPAAEDCLSGGEALDGFVDELAAGVLIGVAEEVRTSQQHVPELHPRRHEVVG